MFAEIPYRLPCHCPSTTEYRGRVIKDRSIPPEERRSNKFDLKGEGGLSDWSPSNEEWNVVQWNVIERHRR